MHGVSLQEGRRGPVLCVGGTCVCMLRCVEKGNGVLSCPSLWRSPGAQLVELQPSTIAAMSLSSPSPFVCECAHEHAERYEHIFF